MSLYGNLTMTLRSSNSTHGMWTLFSPTSNWFCAGFGTAMSDARGICYSTGTAGTDTLGTAEYKWTGYDFFIVILECFRTFHSTIHCFSNFSAMFQQLFIAQYDFDSVCMFCVELN